MASPHTNRKMPTILGDFRFLPSLPGIEKFAPLILELIPSGILMEFLSPKVLVGRHSKADFRLPSPSVSRHQCLFLVKNGEWFVCDLGSKNGTYLNGNKVDVSRFEVDAKLEIGEFHFKVKSCQAAAQIGEMVQNLRLAG